MSDYLVTDIELTETADAIRAKTGDANPIEWESGTGFADAVAAIPSGGGGEWIETDAISLASYYYVSAAAVNTKPTVPDHVKFLAPYCREINGILGQAATGAQSGLGVTEATFELTYPVTASLSFYRNATLKTVNFVNGVTLTGSIANFAYQANVLETINGEIDMTSIAAPAANAAAFNIATLKDIRFKKNALYLHNWTFNLASALTDASLVSIANGLSSSASGLSVAFHATPKARCSTLMGTVTSGEFTQNAGGTVSLADFITNTKGWTLA